MVPPSSHTAFKSSEQFREFLGDPEGEFPDRLADSCHVFFNLDEFLYVD
jgi:hypothetical protein